MTHPRVALAGSAPVKCCFDGPERRRRRERAGLRLPSQARMVTRVTDRDFGSLIRDVRRRAHVSFRELSDQAGVSNPYLQGERGVRRPSSVSR